MSFIKSFKSISNLYSSKTTERRSYDNCLVTNREDSVTDLSDNSEHDLSLYVSASSASVEATPGGTSVATRQSTKKRDEFFHSLSLSPVDKTKKPCRNFITGPRTRTTRNSKNSAVNSKHRNQKIQQVLFGNSKLRKSKKPNENRISIFPDEIFVSSDSEFDASFQGQSSKPNSPKNQKRISQVHLKKQFSFSKLGTGKISAAEKSITQTQTDSEFDASFQGQNSKPNSPKNQKRISQVHLKKQLSSPKLGTGKISAAEKSITQTQNLTSSSPQSQRNVLCSSLKGDNTTSDIRTSTIEDLAKELSSNQQGSSSSTGQSPADRFQPLSKPVSRYTLHDFIVVLKDFIGDVECLMFGGGNSVKTEEMMVQLTAIKSYLRCNASQAQKAELTNFVKLNNGMGRSKKITVPRRKLLTPRRTLRNRNSASEVQGNRSSKDERAQSVGENTKKRTATKSPKRTEMAKGPKSKIKPKSNEPKRPKTLETIVNSIKTKVKQQSVTLNRGSTAEINHIEQESNIPTKSTDETNQTQQESKSNKNDQSTTKQIKQSKIKKKVTLKTKKLPKRAVKVVVYRRRANTSVKLRSQDKGDLLTENVRRSSRVRFLPLKYWASERIKRNSDGTFQVESKKSYIAQGRFITVKELKELKKSKKKTKRHQPGVGSKMVKSGSPKRKNTKVSSPKTSPTKVRKTKATLKQSAMSAKQSIKSSKQSPKSAKQSTKSGKQFPKSAKQSLKSAEQSTKSGKQFPKSAKQSLKSAEQSTKIAEQSSKSAKQSPKGAKQGGQLKTRKLNSVKGKSPIKPKPKPTTSNKVKQNSAITKQPLGNTRKDEQTKAQTSSAPKGIKRQSKPIYNTPKHRKIESSTPNTSTTSSGGKRLLYSPEKWLDTFQQSFVCAQ